MLTEGSCFKFLKTDSHVPPQYTSFHDDAWFSELPVKRRYRELDWSPYGTLNRTSGWRHISQEEKGAQISRFASRGSFPNALRRSSRRGFRGSAICAYDKVFSLEKEQPWPPLATRIALASLGRKAEKRGEARPYRQEDWIRIRNLGEGKAGESQLSREGQRGSAGSLTDRAAKRKFGRRNDNREETQSCRMEMSRHPSPHSKVTGEPLCGETDEVIWSERKLQDDRQFQDQIPRSELIKIHELRFSGDLWEGDSGPQVLNLQRALYWFGHLPEHTSLTASFGPETKKALQQFQIAHGVPDDGVWGALSRQALWKHLCADTCDLSESGTRVQRNGQNMVSSVNSLLFRGKNAVRDIRARVDVPDSFNLTGVHELLSSVSSAPYWKHVPQTAGLVGLVFAVLFVLFRLGYSVVGMVQGQHGEAVRRRMLKAHWRDDLKGGARTRTRKHLDNFPGLDHPLAREEELIFPGGYRFNAMSIPTPSDAFGRTDRLVIHEGEVILGNSPRKKRSPFRNGPLGQRVAIQSTSHEPFKAKEPFIPVLAEQGSDPRKLHVAGPQEEVQYPSEVGTVDNLDLSQLAGNRTALPPAGHDKSVRDEIPAQMGNPFSGLGTPRELKQPSLQQKPAVRKAMPGISKQAEAKGLGRGGLRQGWPESKASLPDRSSRIVGGDWQGKDEVDLREQVEELRKAVQAAELNRQAAMHALAEERQRSLELRVKMSRQKEAAVALEEEVRVLKESHDALLVSLRKKYSSSLSARAAAALLYQNWDTHLWREVLRTSECSVCLIMRCHPSLPVRERWRDILVVPCHHHYDSPWGCLKSAVRWFYTQQ